MKVVQKILSHGLLITFFVAIFFLYLYRGALFPQWFGASAEHRTGSAESVVKESRPAPVVDSSGAEQHRPDRRVVDDYRRPGNTKVSPPAPAPAQSAPGLPPLVTEDESASAAHGLPPLVDDDEQASVANLPPLVEDGATAPEPGAMPAESAPVTEIPMQTSPMQPPTADSHAPLIDRQAVQPVPVEVPETVVQPIEQVPTELSEPQEPATEPHEPVKAEAKDVPDLVSDEAESAPQPVPADNVAPLASDYPGQLAAARELFWKRDVTAAVYAYTQLVRSYPDRPGAWGELGNLYMTLGNKEKAADAYYQAIGLLIQQGQAEEAHNMLGVMQTLDPEKTNELKQWLEQAER